MASSGIRRALAFVTSAYSSYSSCRQYLEDIERARAAAGENAPTVDKIRPFFDHPGFIEANRARLAATLSEIPPERRASAHLLFTAHSIPLSMAKGSEYERQLGQVRTLVASGLPNPAHLVYQSRSGPPSQPWLSPDILDQLRELARNGVRDVVIAPIGFVSEHLEVVYDLDFEAKRVGQELGIELFRVKTVSSHPRFVRMVRELVEESLLSPPRECARDCCPQVIE